MISSTGNISTNPLNKVTGHMFSQQDKQQCVLDSTGTVRRGFRKFKHVVYAAQIDNENEKLHAISLANKKLLQERESELNQKELAYWNNFEKRQDEGVRKRRLRNQIHAKYLLEQSEEKKLINKIKTNEENEQRQRLLQLDYEFARETCIQREKDAELKKALWKDHMDNISIRKQMILDKNKAENSKEKCLADQIQERRTLPNPKSESLNQKRKIVSGILEEKQREQAAKIALDDRRIEKQFAEMDNKKIKKEMEEKANKILVIKSVNDYRQMQERQKVEKKTEEKNSEVFRKTLMEEKLAPKETLLQRRKNRKATDDYNHALVAQKKVQAENLNIQEREERTQTELSIKRDKEIREKQVVQFMKNVGLNDHLESVQKNGFDQDYSDYLSALNGEALPRRGTVKENVINLSQAGQGIQRNILPHLPQPPRNKPLCTSYNLDFKPHVNPHPPIIKI